MVFINEMKFEKLEGFLDTEDKVREARATLEHTTKTTFEELKKAKMASWEDAHRILLD